MTWGEVVRRLRKAGFREQRAGKGSHRRFVHPVTSKEIWVAIHTKKDAGRLGERILKDAGLL
jgi:predicted RNA binding protein YcfA (HicA-like mRNA interferase family)